MTIAETVTLVVFSLIAICKHTTFALVITDLIRVSSLSDFRKNLQTNEPQILVWKRSDHDVSKLFNNDLMHFAYDNRNELFDREIYLTKDGEFSSTTFFAGLEHVDIYANNSFASVCIDMDQLIDSMRLIATENDNIICRLAVVSGVRCPKWHEDYVDLRLIKSYCGSGTDWIDPNDLPTRFLNFFRARADMDLIALNSEDIIHGECGDTIVIPGRKRQLKVPDSVPVLHRSPITEENCRRLLFTVTINAAKMAPLNGVNIIKGEIHSIVTLMRLNTRWSKSSVYRNEAEDGQGSFIHLFRRLNEYLEGLFNLAEVDCVCYILPFHSLIVSDKASGPLTSAALSSLTKFVLYGFLNSSFPRAKEGMALLSGCICQCIFEETDWESDELILMKLLELSALCMQSDASNLLSISSAWDIYSTCLSIHSHYRASKILKSEAETALVHLTLSIFSRVNYVNDLEEQIPVDDQIIDPSELAEQVRLGSCVGLSLLLRKIMSVLSDMLDPNSGLQKQKQKGQGGKGHGRQAMESMRFSLFLVNIALEAGGPALSSMPSLVETLRNDLCRHLLRASQAENLTILSLALRVVFNLFMSIKEHMKVQLEVFLTSVHLRLLNKPSGAVFASHHPISPKEELALESLLEFCREPSLMIDLYTNYDCDVQCTNLFDSIVNTLCVRSLPRGVPHSLLCDSTANPSQRDSNVAVSNSNTNSSTNGITINVDILNKLAFDGLLSILRTVANKFSSQDKKSNTLSSPVESRTKSATDGDEGNDGSLAIVENLFPIDLPLPPPPPPPRPPQPPVLVSPIPLILPQRSHVRIHYGAQRKPPPQRTANDESHLLKVGSTMMGNSSGDTKSVDSAVVVPLSEGTADQQVDLWCESVDPDYIDQEFDSTEAETEDFEDDNQSNRSNQGRSEKSLSLNLPNQEVHEFPMIFSVNKKQSKSNSSHVPFSPAQISKELRRKLTINSNNGSNTSLNDPKEPVLATTKESAITLLRQRKIMKQKLKLAAERFNVKPLKVDWVKYALKIGILEPKNVVKNPPTDAMPLHDDATSVPEKKPVVNAEELLTDAKSVALFLRNTPGLGKTQIGEYISKGPPDLYPFNASVLREYVNTFDFSGTNSEFDKALRLFLGHFRLPGEAQCIDRLMEAFASRLFTFLGRGKPFETADAAFILSFSTIMLNTDLHNPQIPVAKKMTKEQFIRNNRGINDGKDLPVEYLDNLYNEIKSRQIQVDVGINDTAAQFVDYTDSATWNKLMRKGAENQAPPVFTSLVSVQANSARSPTTSQAVYEHTESFAAISSNLSHERDMFLVTAKAVVETIIVLWEYNNDDYFLAKLAQSVWDFSVTCLGFEFLNIYSKFTTLVTIRCKDMMRRNRNLAIKIYTHASALSSKAGFKQLKLDTGQDLQSLMSNKDLVGPQRFAQEDALLYEAVPLNWTDASLVKSELLVKVLFSLLSKHSSCSSLNLSVEAWQAILRFLLFARYRGALPIKIALIGVEDFKSLTLVQQQGSVTHTNCLSRLTPSVYAQQRILKAYGSSVMSQLNVHELNGICSKLQDMNLKSSLDLELTNAVAQSNNTASSSWISNIGEFFWSSNRADSNSSSALESVNEVGESNLSLAGIISTVEQQEQSQSQIFIQLLFSNANASANLDPRTHRPIRPDDELLLLGLESSRIETLLFDHQTSQAAQDTSQSLISKEGKATVVKAATITLIDILKQYMQYENLTFSCSPDEPAVALTGSIQENIASDVPFDLTEHFPDHLFSTAGDFLQPSESEKVSASQTELDLVLLLEWTARMVLSSKETTNDLWFELHEFLSTVLDHYADVVSRHLPYFFERCIVVSITATIRLVEFQDPSSSASVAPEDKVWISLNLLRSLSSDVVFVLAEQLGRGVNALLRVAHVQNLNMHMEQWYMIFSVLSAATSGVSGRPAVWSSICYLVHHGLINEVNFIPCRHILLRFFQGVFPGDEPSPNYIQSAVSYDAVVERVGEWNGELVSGQWNQLSMGFLTRFCLMSLSGYLSGNGNQKKTFVFVDWKTGEKYGFSDPMKATNGPLSFVLPSTKKYFSSRPNLFQCEVDEAFLIQGIRIPSQSEQQKALADKVMPTVCFRSSEEVEMMFFETVKLFCDYRPVSTSNLAQRMQQLFCIECLLLGGHTCKLPSGLWLRALNEALTRLPVAISPNLSSIADLSHALPVSWQGCVMIMDVLVSAFGEKRIAADFSAVYLRFVKLLASNAAATATALTQCQPNARQVLSAFLEEMVILLEATVRMMRLPAALLKSTTTQSQTVAAHSLNMLATSSPAVGAGQSGYFGNFLNWVSNAPASNAAAEIPTTEGSASIEPSDWVSIQRPGLLASDGAADADDDGELLSVAWKTIVNIYPPFSNLLRSRNQKLFVDLMQLQRGAASATDSVQTTGESSRTTKADKNATAQDRHLPLPPQQPQQLQRVRAGSGATSNAPVKKKPSNALTV